MELLREAAVLTAPNETYARERTARRRGPQRLPTRDLVEEFAEMEEEGGYNGGRRRTGLRLTFRAEMPRSLWGRLAAGSALLAILVLAGIAVVIARRTVLRDERFVLASSSSVIIEGNEHVSRVLLLEVFGGDIQRNILRVSLEERKAELEQIPWVKHATVMRLLPDHIRVLIEERTPVAFVRQSGHIGLVDTTGVLLDMGSEKAESTSYSFPVVTGISPSDPISVRGARMKIYEDFTKDLDATGENVSAKLSEIDLSNPEDLKALIADGGGDILVHFGDSDYLDRYKKYEAHLPEWRTQYPKLSSVDMRYERQVVLEMQPGTAVPLAGSAPEGAGRVTGGALVALASRAGRGHPRAKGRATVAPAHVVARAKVTSPKHAAGRAAHP